jgi:Holliday junction resolvasome RuvABC endonuclease subunit
VSTPILALDLGDTTGWATADEHGAVSSGVLDLSIADGEHPGQRWARARRTIADLAYRTGASRIAWERVVNVGGPWSRSTLYGLEVQVVEVCATLLVEPLTVMPSSLKKHATGNGRAKKPQMRAAAARRFGRDPESFATHDEADALCVLGWALDEINGGRS